MFKAATGGLSAVLMFGLYVPYFRDLARGTTKPHVFTWLVWSITASTVFLAQVTHDAGPGAWATGVDALLAIAVLIWAIRIGNFDIKLLDWFSLSGAALAAGLWAITDGPLLSVIFATLTDMLGFIPTIRKSWSRPREETLSMYVVGSFGYAISLFALTSVTFITAFNPIVVGVANGAFASILIFRRIRIPA